MLRYIHQARGIFPLNEFAYWNSVHLISAVTYEIE